jgi:hypothetical protein
MPFDPTAFANAESNFNRDDPPAPGEYEVVVTDIDIFTAKDGYRQFAKVTYKVVSGFARDHVWGPPMTLDALKADGEPNGGLSVTKSNMRVLLGDDVVDSQVPTLADLRRALERIVGRQYVVEVVRNGQYVNTYPRRALNSTSGSTPNASDYGQQQQQPAQPSASGIGTPAGGSNAVYQGDGPSSSSQQSALGADVRRDVERTGQSDVPGAQPGDFEHPPQKGDLDPETGEPIPF